MCFGLDLSSWFFHQYLRSEAIISVCESLPCMGWHYELHFTRRSLGLTGEVKCHKFWVSWFIIHAGLVPLPRSKLSLKVPVWIGRQRILTLKLIVLVPHARCSAGAAALYYYYLFLHEAFACAVVIKVSNSSAVSQYFFNDLSNAYSSLMYLLPAVFSKLLNRRHLSNSPSGRDDPLMASFLPSIQARINVFAIPFFAVAFSSAVNIPSLRVWLISLCEKIAIHAFLVLVMAILYDIIPGAYYTHARRAHRIEP